MSSNRYRPILSDLAQSGPFEFSALTDEWGTLAVVVHDVTNRETRVAFEDYLAYRKRDEGDALTELHQISSQGVIGRWFYEVDGPSEFVEWFHAHSLGIRKKLAPRHFLLALNNDLIDVLSLNPPLVTGPTP